MSDFVAETVESVRQQVGDATVICGLSGGVDSSVTAALLHKAIGDQLVCIFVDNGLLRRNERESIVSTFRDHFHIDLRVVDWSSQFLAALAGVTDPQQKRKIIGAEFIEAFKSEACKIPNARFLAQGTLYPDVIESGHKDGNPAANIKLHHNVGGLPAELGFELVEPLRDLFKDEVRVVGEYLGLPEDIVWRHPFPGPGLAVRIIGEVTPKRLEVLRAADEILIDEIKAAGLYRKISQALAVLVPVSTVGVMGDERSYENVDRDPRRGNDRLHDRRLLAHPLRGPRHDLQPDHQRGPRRQPRRLRHLQQTPRHHRVGIGEELRIDDCGLRILQAVGWTSAHAGSCFHLLASRRIEMAQ